MEKFDNKLREIETMVTLLECKLNSLPSDITSKYPPLVHVSINDLNPQINTQINTQLNTQLNTQINDPAISNNQGVNPNGLNDRNTQNNQNLQNPNVSNPNENVQNENNNQMEVEKIVVEETPEQKLKSFIEENNSEDLEKYYKMLKFGIPEQAVIQKCMMTGFDSNLINVS